MNIAEKLDALRNTLPACDLVAFGDLGTRLVLRTSATRPCPQEQLDRIAALAARSFALSDAVHAELGLPAPEQDILVLTAQDTRLLARSRRNAADFLCCSVPPGKAVPPLSGPAHAFLDDIAEG